MSRLLFAAARGARILNNKGKPVKYVWVWPEIAIPDFGVHIHPDDAHLQYGPISTALRKLAEEPPRTTEAIRPVERHYLNVYTYADALYRWTDDLHRSLMLLFVAECLADEGL